MTSVNILFLTRLAFPVLLFCQLAHQEILVLHNKQPVFEPSIGAFCLNFHGRATVASVKNFQLVNSREDKLQQKQDSKVHLQFGKVRCANSTWRSPVCS